MNSDNDILKKVRKIEIKTKGLSNQIFAGKYHSAFKGRGMSFSEVREYRIGDDVRDIDWNVTARTREPHIKTYEEERELTMMLLIDVSASRLFGSTDNLKKNIMTEIASILAFSASQNNDKIGCIFYSDKIEKYIPAKKGRQHILLIIRELISFTPTSKKTDIGVAIEFLTNVLKKRSTAFIISDFMDINPITEKCNFESSLKIASKKHDIVGIKIYDKREVSIPNVGIIEFNDAETGEKIWIDSSSAKVRNDYSAYWKKASFIIDNTLMRYRVDSVSISTSEDYVKSLIKLFKQR